MILLDLSICFRQGPLCCRDKSTRRLASMQATQTRSQAPNPCVPIFDEPDNGIEPAPSGDDPMLKPNSCSELDVGENFCGCAGGASSLERCSPRCESCLASPSYDQENDNAETAAIRWTSLFPGVGIGDWGYKQASALTPCLSSTDGTILHAWKRITISCS